MEKIGMEAILEMAKFNQGKQQYVSGTDEMVAKTEKSSGIFSKMGGALEGIAKVGIGAAVAGFGALTAVVASSIGEAAAAQEAEAQLDAVLRSTGAAAAEQGKQWEAAQGKTVTSTRLSAATIADLTSKLEDQKLKHNTLGAAIQEQQQKVIQLTQQYGDQGLATLKAKARLAEMKAQYDDQGKSIDTLTDKIAKGGEKITVSLADKLGLVPPIVQMTKDEIYNLADALSRVTPFEDDLIVSTEAVLLQFKNLGKDVMPQATELALDLAQRLGVDATSAAKMLGKALVEPGEGLARLKAAGVSFTDEQEKMIKKMYESGDVAGAQKYIMDTLSQSIGGAARAAGETFTGKMEILKNSIGNVKETIGGAFLPVLTTLADKFASFVQENAPAIQAFFQGIADWISTKAIPALLELYNWLATNLPPVIQYLSDLWTNTLQPALATVWNFLSTYIIPVLMEIWRWEAEMLPIAIQILSDFWTNTLQPALLAVWTFITTSVIPALLEIYNWLATNIPPAIQFLSDLWTGTLQPALAAVWSFIQTNLIPIFQTVAGWFSGEGTSSTMGWVDTIRNFLGPIIQFAYDQFSFIVNWVKQNWPLIQKTVETVMLAVQKVIDAVLTVVKKIIETALAAIKKFWEDHGASIKKIVSDVWEIIKTTIDTVIKTIADIIKAVMQIINGDWEGAWETIRGAAERIWEAIKTIVGKGFDAIKELFRIGIDGIKRLWDGISDWAYGIGKAIVDGIKQGLKDLWDSLMQWIRKRIKEIKDMVSELFSLGSPSRWAIEVGQMVTVGLGKGMEKGFKVPITAVLQGVQDVKSALVNELGGGLMTGYSRQALTPAYAGSQNVNVSFGDTTINSGLDAELFQAQVLQTVTRAVRGY